MDEKETENVEEAVETSKTSASDTFFHIMKNMICQKDVELIHNMQLES